MVSLVASSCVCCGSFLWLVQLVQEIEFVEDDDDEGRRIERETKSESR
jgi:hypothetical protein